MTPPAASAAAAAAPAIHPRRTTGPRRAPATRRPRRVSGPARPAPAPARNRNPARSQARLWTAPLHALGLAEAVASHRLLDRLIRGRMWIGVIAFALIGIVTMQLVLLKLNAGIGRSLVREALLQRENTTLSAENSELGAGEQIEARAARDGMEPIPAGALRFLSSHAAGDVGKAAAALSAPISSTSVEGSTPSSSSTTEAATATTTTTGEASAQSTATNETVATPSAPAASAETAPAATTTETQASGASTPTSSTGASEATPSSQAPSSQAPSSQAPSTETPSATTSAAGGTPGG